MSYEAANPTLKSKELDGGGGGGGGDAGSSRVIKWGSLDVTFMTVGLVLIHLLCVFAPFTFTWSALYVCLVLGVVSTFGISFSYHRNLAHQSFTLPKWLEYFFAYCGVLALQSDPIYWVSIHRHHHQFVDTERDPHSPKEGFWFSHIGWLFDNKYLVDKVKDRKNVEDLKKQPYYMFIRKTYPAHVLAQAIVLFAIGGFPYLIWAMAVRTVLVYHFVFAINSVCHTFGTQVWDTNDLSKNVWWYGWWSFGEGWHDNHHAFEFSARLGLEWWQIDFDWYVICLLRAMGLATNVKVPTEEQKKRKLLSSSDKYTK